MNMVSHGIPSTTGYDEHEDIASYSQTLNSLRRSHSLLRAKQNNIFNNSSEDVTDDPFSCTFDKILDLEESQFLLHESQSSPLEHANSLPAYCGFSSVATNLDCDYLKSKLVFHGRSSSVDGDSENNKTESSATMCKDTVNDNQESNMLAEHVQCFTNECSDEHHSIKNMVQCIQEPQLMNEHEIPSDIQSCEHALIEKLSHTLQCCEDKQYKTCLQKESASKGSEYSTLEPSGYVSKCSEVDNENKGHMIQTMKSDANSIGHGRFTRSQESISKKVNDDYQDQLKKNSPEPSLNALKIKTVCNTKVLQSTVGVDHAGSPSGVEITKVFPSPKSSNEADVISSRKSVGTSFLYQQKKSREASYVSLSIDSKTTKTISSSISSRWGQREGDFGTCGANTAKREVSSHLKNVDEKIETTDQLKHCEVSSTPTSEAIHLVQSDKFPGTLNINQPHESSTMNYELIIQEHSLCGDVCDEQDMNLNPQSLGNIGIQSTDLDSSSNGIKTLHRPTTQENRLGVPQSWIATRHKLAMFENSIAENNGNPVEKHQLNTGDNMHRLSSLEKRSAKGTSIAQDLKAINMRPELMSMSIKSIPSNGTIASSGVKAPLPSPVSPVAENCKENLSQSVPG